MFISKEEKKGIRKLVKLLRNADPTKFVRNTTHQENKSTKQVLYCSMGMLAKELGYEYIRDDFGHLHWSDETPYQFVENTLHISDMVTSEVIDQNDHYCSSFECVANAVEQKFLKQ